MERVKEKIAEHERNEPINIMKIFPLLMLITKYSKEWEDMKNTKSCMKIMKSLTAS